MLRDFFNLYFLTTSIEFKRHQGPQVVHQKINLHFFIVLEIISQLSVFCRRHLVFFLVITYELSSIQEKQQFMKRSIYIFPLYRNLLLITHKCALHASFRFFLTNTKEFYSIQDDQSLMIYLCPRYRKFGFSTKCTLSASIVFSFSNNIQFQFISLLQIYKKNNSLAQYQQGKVSQGTQKGLI